MTAADRGGLNDRTPRAFDVRCAYSRGGDERLSVPPRRAFLSSASRRRRARRRSRRTARLVLECVAMQPHPLEEEGRQLRSTVAWLRTREARAFRHASP